MIYKCTIEFNAKHPIEAAASITYANGYGRTTSKVEHDGNKVFIKIGAKDITALRACMNDYARLLRVCEIERWL